MNQKYKNYTLDELYQIRDYYIKQTLKSDYHIYKKFWDNQIKEINEYIDFVEKEIKLCRETLLKDKQFLMMFQEIEEKLTKN